MGNMAFLYGNGGGVKVEQLTVQKKSGSFTTNTNGSATVSNLGIKPDVVIIKVGTNQYNYTQNDPAFAFTESGKTQLSCTSVSKTSGYNFMTINCTQSSSGFSVTMTNIDNSWQTSTVKQTSFNYIAIQYT